MKTKYQVIEDNGGNMYLFFFDEGDGDNVILGFLDIEYLEPGELDDVSYKDALDWENHLPHPQTNYDYITSFDFGWAVVADQDRTYPDRMGRAAELVFRIETE